MEYVITKSAEKWFSLTVYVACFYFACDGIRGRNMYAENTSPLTPGQAAAREKFEEKEKWDLDEFLTLEIRCEEHK